MGEIILQPLVRASSRRQGHGGGLYLQNEKTVVHKNEAIGLEPLLFAVFVHPVIDGRIDLGPWHQPAQMRQGKALGSLASSFRILLAEILGARIAHSLLQDRGAVANQQNRAWAVVLAAAQHKRASVNSSVVGRPSRRLGK